MTTKIAALTALHLSSRIIQDSTSRMLQWFVCSEFGTDEELNGAMKSLSDSVDALESILRKRLGK